MKKTIFIALAILALLQANPLPALAWRGGHDGHWGGHDGHWGHWDHDGHGHFGVELWLGPGWIRPYYPYEPYYPYPYYYPPPTVIVPREPEVYIQPAPQPEASDYWYYCQDPPGYYPYVKRCPGGWMKVVPTPPPGQKE